MKRKRIIIDLIIVVSVFVFPWWIPAIISVVALYFIDNFLEIIVVALIYDLLYSSPIGLFGGLQFPTTIVALAIYVAFSVLKKYTLINAK